jgi:hypothetical protein
MSEHIETEPQRIKLIFTNQRYKKQNGVNGTACISAQKKCAKSDFVPKPALIWYKNEAFSWLKQQKLLFVLTQWANISMD